MIDPFSGYAATVNQAGLFPPVTSMTLGLATTLGLKEYVAGVDAGVTFSSTPAGWALSRAVFVPYKMVGGQWRLRFNITASVTAATLINVTCDGVIFYQQTNAADRIPISASAGVSAYVEASVIRNSGTIQLGSGANTVRFQVSGDVELDSAPSWAITS